METIGQPDDLMESHIDEPTEGEPSYTCEAGGSYNEALVHGWKIEEPQHGNIGKKGWKSI